VITVVSGWFMTALIAFSVAFVFANIIHYTNGVGVLLLLAFVGFVIVKNHKAHNKRSKEAEEAKVYNLRKIKDAAASRAFTFKHMGHLLKEIRKSLDVTFDALFAEDVATLRMQKKKVKQIQQWVNIITANIFKVLRLQQQEQDILTSYKYAQTIRRLQKLSDGHRDIVLRSYVHVSNHHKGLLPIQIDELKRVKESILNILSEVEDTFGQRRSFTPEVITKQLLEIRSHADLFHFKQIERIQDETSKTRLSILFYAIVGNCMMLGKQNLKLLEIFEESFPPNNKQE
jgi:Ca2+/Na+ antiporter